MTRFFNLIAALLTVLAASGCDLPDWGLGDTLPIPGTNDTWCVSGGVGMQDGEVTWADVELHKCVPVDAYVCPEPWYYDGVFGSEICQGEVGLPDAYTIYFSTSDQVTLATLEWKTDEMDQWESTVLYPVHDGQNFHFVTHVLNPGYTSQGDDIRFKISLQSNAGELKDPTVTVELDGGPEDVTYNSNSGEYRSSW